MAGTTTVAIWGNMGLIDWIKGLLNKDEDDFLDDIDDNEE